MKDHLLEHISPYGFVGRRGIYYRIKNDVVQGFVLRREAVLGGRLHSVWFATYPLCDPYGQFYDLFFEVRDIGFLDPKLSVWPFYQKLKFGTPDTAYKQETLACVMDTLVPYFERYCTCEIAHKSLPELLVVEEPRATYNAVFFALKAGDRDSAVRSLNAMLAQRKDALADNKRYFSEDSYKELEATVLAQDAETLKMMDRIAKSTGAALLQYLLENEERGRAFLEKAAR